MSNLQSVKNNYSKEFLRSVRDGDGWPGETDSDLNDACRKVISAIHNENGECWLGKINLYGDERHGNTPYIWKWDGGLVYNFGCAFVIPKFDQELETLIRERDDAVYSARVDYERINKIMDRIKELGGVHLFWT